MAAALKGTSCPFVPRGGLAAGGRLHGPPGGCPAAATAPHGGGGGPVQPFPHPLLLHAEEPVGRQPPGVPGLRRPPRGDEGRARQDQAAAPIREYWGAAALPCAEGGSQKHRRGAELGLCKALAKWRRGPCGWGEQRAVVAPVVAAARPAGVWCGNLLITPLDTAVQNTKRG